MLWWLASLKNISFDCGHFIYGSRWQGKIGSPLMCFVLFNAFEHARNNMAIHIRLGRGATIQTFITKSCKHTDPCRAPHYRLEKNYTRTSWNKNANDWSSQCIVTTCTRVISGILYLFIRTCFNCDGKYICIKTANE